MFNFNKVFETISKDKVSGSDPTLNNVDKKEEVGITPTLEGGADMYTVLMNGDEMGVVKRDDVKLAKETFDQLHSQYPEEINALNGKKPEEVLSVLKSLMN